MALEDVLEFHDDDQSYEAWVSRNGGYVLTVSPGKPGFMLHDSECPHLGTDGLDIRLTKKPRRWAKQRRDLVEWTEREVGERPKLCQTCM